MFGDGEAPPSGTISTITKAAGPIIDRLWSRAPRAGGLVPTRSVPTSSSYPRPTRPLMGIFDIIQMAPSRSEVKYFAWGLGVATVAALLVAASRRSSR